MSRRLLLAGAVAVLAALLPGTAAAEAERGTVVVEGQGGTTTEWEQPGPLPIDVPLDGTELVGGGAYAGALFEPLDGRRSPLGVVQVRAFADETRAAVARLGVQLAPGRYRVTLFGNGPVRVVLPNNDREAPGIRIVPRTPTPVAFVGRSQPLTTGYSTARVDLAGALPAGRRALQITLLTGNQVGRSQSCATRGTECEEALLPACFPSPAGCGPTTQGPQPGASFGDARAGVGLVRPEPAPRRLLWSFEGYRTTEDKLRAAAIIF